MKSVSTRTETGYLFRKTGLCPNRFCLNRFSAKPVCIRSRFKNLVKLSQAEFTHIVGDTGSQTFLQTLFIFTHSVSQRLSQENDQPSHPERLGGGKVEGKSSPLPLPASRSSKPSLTFATANGREHYSRREESLQPPGGSITAAGR